MQTISTQFESELRKLLSKRMIDIADILTGGQAVKDYAEYRRYVGEFQALKQVVEIYCDEVNTKINER